MNIIKKLRGLFFGWWIIIASIVLNMIIGGVTLYGFTAFYNPIVLEMGWTRAQTALAFSLRSVEGGIVMPLIGFFIDRVGTRKCISIGILILGISYILMSRIHSLPAFYVAFLVMALGNSMGGGIAQYTAVANWFRRKRARAMAVLSAGFGISGVMTPFLVYLIHTYGWRQSIFGIAFVIWAIGIPLAVVVRHRPEPYGYLPDGDKPGAPAALETSEVAARGRGRTPLWSQDTASEGLTLGECVKTRNFWLLVLFNGFTAIAQSTMNVLVMSHLISCGIAENIAALTVTGITTSSLIGRLGIGWLGDTFDKKKLLVIAIAMKAIGIFFFANIRAPWMIIPFLIMYGPGFGAPIPLMFALTADCFGTKSFGSIRGMMALGHMTLGILAPLFAGWVYDTQGSYRFAFTIFSIIVAFAIPVIMMVRVPSQKKEGVGAPHKTAS